MAMEDLGGKCVFASEIEPNAAKVYEDNFGDEPKLYGDITKLPWEKTDQVKKELGEFDILVGGFPCQAFSMAGKRNGFKDDRGKLFDYIDKILGICKPKAFLLENVVGLVSQDKGKTLEHILSRLNKLGYYVPDPQILDASDYGVPQKRKRIYIVGFREDLGIDKFDYPKPTTPNEEDKKTLESVMTAVRVPNEYYLSQGYLDCLKNHKKKQHEEGRGFGYCILKPGDIPNTLMGGGMGRERNLIRDDKIGNDRTTKTHRKTPINSENIRALTPREFARIQGFPDDFKIDVSKTYAYKLFGNSVAIDVVYYVGLEMMKSLKSKKEIKNYKVRVPDSKKYNHDLTKID